MHTVISKHPHARARAHTHTHTLEIVAQPSHSMTELSKTIYDSSEKFNVSKIICTVEDMATTHYELS